MKKETARVLLQEHYDRWKTIDDNSSKDGGFGNKFIWFAHVQKENPELLNFKHTGDIWQKINAMIK